MKRWVLAVTLLSACCGGSTVDECASFATTPLDKVPWDAALATARKCLPPEDVDVLIRTRAEYEHVNLPELFGLGKTAQQEVAEARRADSFAKDLVRDLAVDEAKVAAPIVAPNTRAIDATSPIKKTVVFVYAGMKLANGHTDDTPDATAFIVKVPDKTHTRFMRLLVTARHVLEPAWAACAAAGPPAIKLRFNKRGGGLAFVRIELTTKDGKAAFITPGSDNADVAVLVLTKTLIPDLEEYEFLDVPFENLSTAEEEKRFHDGQQILTAGLQPDFPGTTENLPIFRAGTVSRIPKEPAPIPCTGDTVATRQVQVWTIAASLFPGMSGAPVFTMVDRGVRGRLTPVVFGVQSIVWAEKGEAGVTPGAFLVDAIEKAAMPYPVDLTRGVHR